VDGKSNDEYREKITSTSDVDVSKNINYKIYVYK
jgi:hypothetical protein